MAHEPSRDLARRFILERLGRDWEVNGFGRKGIPLTFGRVGQAAGNERKGNPAQTAFSADSFCAVAAHRGRRNRCSKAPAPIDVAMTRFPPVRLKRARAGCGC